MLATGNSTYDSLRSLYELNKPVGNSVNSKLMRDFRTYMAVGGMPQAVDAYVTEPMLLSQKDVGKDKVLKLKPIYMIPFVLEDVNLGAKYG